LVQQNVEDSVRMVPWVRDCECVSWIDLDEDRFH